MRVHTMRDLGAAARQARRVAQLTQQQLATRMGVSREWVVRLEQGHPRLEAQLVLDALEVLDLDVVVSARAEGDVRSDAETDDPFADVRRRVLER